MVKHSFLILNYNKLITHIGDGMQIVQVWNNIDGIDEIEYVSL